MHLQRVQVPDFRVLKDVDITFEKNFNPRVFPLGSQNGGGKSTLLQLIFVLLHCSIIPHRLDCLRNLLNGFNLRKDENKRILAIIDIWDDEKLVELEFFICDDSYMKRLLSLDNLINEQKINSSFNEDELPNKVSELFQKDEIRNENLSSKNIEYIFGYSSKFRENEDDSLLCHMKNFDMKKSKLFLEDLSNKIFLAAPYTQVFLFMSKEERDFLFAGSDMISRDYTNYYVALNKSNIRLKGLFTYNFFSVDLLIDFFKAARDKDFREALDTGEYGNNYKKLLNDLDLLLIDKRVNLKANFSELTFISKSDDGIELYPDDLSHGELKRLSIYVWLKHRNIENAIVLMDEVDLALHPDWQYQIVSDLLDWVPSNQYVLATHSYELCNALTPSHVKILRPKPTERRSD